ncbi:MAG: diacylglycerol kinase family lipid kinase [Candidatus Cloacimonetes bacterium]|nr:diacylglycerol kinase family lipid kinase [Candidatus Cloacimonadota bacterium]
MSANLYKIILNPFAGKGKAFRSIRTIEKYFQKFQIEYDMQITDSPKQATEIALESANKGFEYIVAAGGDGTINEVLNGIMKSEYPEKINLGIIAVGAGNDFVKNLSYPRSIDNQIKILRRKTTKKIDIGKIEDLYFINTLGLGFDAQVTKTYYKSKLLNGFIGYLIAVLLTLIKCRTYLVEISVDDKTIIKNTLFITVGNGKCCGGKFHLTPDAKIDDGVFDLCIIDKLTRREIIKFLPKVIKGKHTNLPMVKMLQGNEIIVKSEIDLPVYLDGEIPDLKDKKNIDIKIIPKKLNLIVP